MIVTFLADGTPRSKGSWTIVGKPGGGLRFLPGKDRAAIDNYFGWIETVQLFARRAMGMRAPMDGAVRAEIVFVLPRRKTVKRRWPWAQGEGDLDKLERAVYDACEKIIYTNDARICQHHNLKRYVDESAGERPHASITFQDLS